MTFAVLMYHGTEYFISRISALYFMSDESDVRAAMQYPWVSVGSDAGAGSIETARGVEHPRAYGTFPRIIARCVRENQVLTLELCREPPGSCILLYDQGPGAFRRTSRRASVARSM